MANRSERPWKHVHVLKMQPWFEDGDIATQLKWQKLWSQHHKIINSNWISYKQLFRMIYTDKDVELGYS